MISLKKIVSVYWEPVFGKILSHQACWGIWRSRAHAPRHTALKEIFREAWWLWDFPYLLQDWTRGPQKTHRWSGFGIHPTAPSPVLSFSSLLFSKFPHLPSEPAVPDDSSTVVLPAHFCSFLSFSWLTCLLSLWPTLSVLGEHRALTWLSFAFPDWSLPLC